ncbi:pentapeptide repeat-containing protein [Streptomyces sp. NPDC008196]|uniref:pentapeptide repeat-containing protein n=1 Tax=unclassified Streptomyces TaxID=2593676 RepID=UPI00201104FE|nr:pentapeptide repeat-containing protein [Streptomyces sp. A2-16]
MLLWQGPWWLDGEHLRTDDLQPADGVVVTGVRTALVALGAGVVAAAGLYYTDRSLRHTRERDREQAELSREAQVTDRYVEAIKLLASDRTVERLGGIYALERIMRDSPKDHLTVVEVLASFIREHTLMAAGEGEALQADRHPTEPVQAALTVLGRRPVAQEPFRIDLRATDLRGADLKQARLDRVRLGSARLDGSDLTEARLEDAWLQETGLEGVWLDRADLNKANLRAANLRGASLVDANLAQSKLMGTDLSTAHGCTVEQVRAASVLDEATKLPTDIAAGLPAIE